MNAKRLDSNSERLLDQLVKDANEQGLVLFVGSGVNGKTLPLWDDLLGRLVGQAIKEAGADEPRMDKALAERLHEWCRRSFGLCAQASIVKRILGRERYRVELQDALYENVTDDTAKEIADCSDKKPADAKRSAMLRQVAELCGAPQVKAVATFNFDTLLEYAIASSAERSGQPQSRRPRTYFGQVATFAEPGRPAADTLPVFHVHGLLTPPGALLRSVDSSLVFSYDEYFDKNADPLSWETSTSIHLLRHYCTLWLGASLRDWNMLRLLDAACRGGTRIRSYCLQSLAEVGGAPRIADDHERTYREVAMRLQATLLDAVGVQLIIGGDGFDDLPATISGRITARLMGAGDTHRPATPKERRP